MSPWHRIPLLLALVLLPWGDSGAQVGSPPSWSTGALENLEGRRVFATGPVIVAARVTRDATEPLTHVTLRGEFPQGEGLPVAGLVTYRCGAPAAERMVWIGRKFLMPEGSPIAEPLDWEPRLRYWSWWVEASLPALQLLACGGSLPPAAQRTLLPDSLVRGHRSLGALSTSLQAQGYTDGLVSEWERRSLIACGSVLKAGKSEEQQEMSTGEKLRFFIAAGPAHFGPNSLMAASVDALQDEQVFATAIGVPSVAAMEGNPAMIDAMLTRCKERVDAFTARMSERLRRVP